MITELLRRGSIDDDGSLRCCGSLFAEAAAEAFGAYGYGEDGVLMGQRKEIGGSRVQEADEDSKRSVD